MFRSKRSYLSVSPVSSLRRHCHSKITFKPSKESGVLFLVSSTRTEQSGGERRRRAAAPGGDEDAQDFMALLLTNGSLSLTYNLGESQPFKKEVLGGSILSGKQSYICIEYNFVLMYWVQLCTYVLTTTLYLCIEYNFVLMY